MALISDLPTDVLAFILGRLCLRDYIRCRAVCSEWNLVLSVNPVPRQLPWLLLPRTDADEANETCRFYDFSHGVEFTVALPGIRWWRHCSGSSDGWLIILDDSSDPFLFNPLTSVRIPLPSIATFPDVEPVFDSSGRVSQYNIRQSYLVPQHPDDLNFLDLTVEETWDYYFYKVIVTWTTSDSSYTAVAIGGDLRWLAFARPGDEAWKIVKRRSKSNPFEDVILHRGLYYTAGVSGTIESHDLNGPFPVIRTVAVDLKLYTWLKLYLVEVSGDILEVLRDVDVNPDFEVDEYRTVGFQIYKIDRGTNKWVEVKNLGDHALFLGGNYSISLSKRDFPALRANSIYFTDDHFEAFLPEYKDQPRDLGVFSLEDGSIEPYHPDGSQLIWPRPIWFVPDLSKRTT